MQVTLQRWKPRFCSIFNNTVTQSNIILLSYTRHCIALLNLDVTAFPSPFPNLVAISHFPCLVFLTTHHQVKSPREQTHRSDGRTVEVNGLWHGGRELHPLESLQIQLPDVPQDHFSVIAPTNEDICHERRKPIAHKGNEPQLQRVLRENTWRADRWASAQHNWAVSLGWRTPASKETPCQGSQIQVFLGYRHSKSVNRETALEINGGLGKAHALKEGGHAVPGGRPGGRRLATSSQFPREAKNPTSQENINQKQNMATDEFPNSSFE